MLKLGVIGFGRRGQHMVREMEALPDVKLTAVADPRLAELSVQFAAENRDVLCYAEADDMLNNADLDGVIVSTRCDSHATMAEKTARRGLPLFLEKPVGICDDDLHILRNIQRQHPIRVVVSFPLRYSPLLRRVKEVIDSGLIGTVENVQAVNNVPYGETYYTNWYRNSKQTGGLFLQKSTHDLDYIFYLLDDTPAVVAAMSSQRVYGGDKPFHLRCADCDEQHTCMESPLNGYLKRYTRATPTDDKRLCLFSHGIDNQDSGTIMVQMQSGVQVTYAQNFYTRNHAAARGARLIGYKGTIDFDWRRGDILVHLHHSPRTERIAFDPGGPKHFGGDRAMAYNFRQVMAGEGESEATLEDGIISALACLRARDSAATMEFKKVHMKAAVR